MAKKEMKLLIVDDDPLFLDFLSGMVGELGFSDATTASSGIDALQLISNTSEVFDCVMLDIQMPIMNGIELCSRIRKIPQYASIPIVMITAFSEKSYVDRAFEAGANDYVNKPVDIVELKARLGMVERVLDERAQAGLLMHQLSETERELGKSIELSSSDIFRGSEDGMLPYMTFENYLLRLGNMRLLPSALCVLSVRNADTLFACMPRIDFIDAMAHVGQCIIDTLSHTSRFVSYAGNGKFCILLPRLAVLDKQASEDVMNGTLSEIFPHSGYDSAFVPRVTFGRTHHFNLFSLRDPTEIVQVAIAEGRPTKTVSAA